MMSVHLSGEPLHSLLTVCVFDISKSSDLTIFIHSNHAGFSPALASPATFFSRSASVNMSR